MSIRNTLAIVFLSTLGVVSCGGGGSDSGNGNEQISTAAFVTPGNAAELASALETRYVSPTDFDVWLCTGEATFAYAFPPAGTLGQGINGLEYNIATGGEAPFVWETLSGTSIRFTFAEQGLSLITTDYQFNGPNQLSLRSDTTQINCNRVSNSVVFGGEPSTETQSNGVLLSLEAENAKIPNSNRPVAATAISTFDPIFFTNDGTMVMQFSNGLQTACVDWDIVNDEPTDCGRDWQVVDFGDLTPFQPGQTINNTFGYLSSTTGAVPNQLAMNSAGEIVIGAGANDIFGIEVESGVELSGRYYLNGFTMTLEFNGQIFHTFAAISSEENGNVTALFLAEDYYAVSLNN